MKSQYETEHLILRIGSEQMAPMVLDFYKKNLTDFAAVEPIDEKQFLSIRYHQTVLAYEYKLTLKLSMLRLWIFLKDDPSVLIGTISFRNILRSPFFACCETGYKMDAAYRHHGYAHEALSLGLSIMFQEYGLHRVEAIVLPENTASIKLLSSLGFSREGLLRKKVRLQGVWRDHFLYSILSDDFISGNRT